MRLNFVIFIIAILNYPEFIIAQDLTKIGCKIWKTEDFCNIPDTFSFPKMSIRHLPYLSWKKCEEIQKLNQVMAVHITIPKNKFIRIKMKRGLKSVVLVNKNRKKIKPIGLLWNNLKSENGTVDFGYITKIKSFEFDIDSDNDQDISLILLFPIAEVGDIIKFKKLFSAFIEE